MNNKIGGNVGCPSAVLGADCKVGLQINVEQILSVLSASLYKGDILETATRELLQNAFDACKKDSNPTIKVNWDSWGRTLMVEDNGSGMATDTVKNVFFTIGGTLKEGLDVSERSGGFGIAKVQFFMAGEHIKIETVRDGVKTIAEATQKELLRGEGILKSMPCDEYSYTRVTIKFPKEYVDASGAVRTLSLNTSSVRSVLKHPLVGYNINVMSTLLVEPAKTPEYKLTKQFSWGEAEIYLPSELSRGYYINADVHCAGLYQFKTDRYAAEGLGLNCVINIKPNHPAGSQYYPFANSRDNFSGYAEKDINTVFEEIKKYAKMLKQMRILEEYSSQELLDYISIDGKVLQRGAAGSSNVPKIDLGALFLECDGLLDAFCKVVERQLKKHKEIEEAKVTNSSTCLRLLNPEGFDLTGCKEMLSKIASIVYDVIYIPNVRDNMTDKPSVAGVTTKKGVRGVFVKIDKEYALYLNPFGAFVNANHFAATMTETLVHELAHSVCPYHDEEFFVADDKFRTTLYKENQYELIYSKFVELYKSYSDKLYKS